MTEAPVLRPRPDRHGIPTSVKIGAGVALAGVGVGLAGYAANELLTSDSTDNRSNINIIPTPGQPAFIPGTEIPNPLATAEASVTPAIAAGFSESDGKFTYRTENGEVLNVPQIDGLTPKLVKEGERIQVQYFAKAENKYGLEPEAYAGEYNPNIKIEGVQKGGVGLDGKVVSKLLAEKPVGTIPLPIDITNGDELSVSIKNVGSRLQPVVYIEGDTEKEVTNPIPGSKKILINSNSVEKMSFTHWPKRGPNDEEIEAEGILHFIAVIGNFKNRSIGDAFDSSFSDFVGDVEGDVILSWSVSNFDQYFRYPITIDTLLSLGGEEGSSALAFINANKPMTK